MRKTEQILLFYFKSKILSKSNFILPIQKVLRTLQEVICFPNHDRKKQKKKASESASIFFSVKTTLSAAKSGMWIFTYASFAAESWLLWVYLSLYLIDFTENPKTLGNLNQYVLENLQFLFSICLLQYCKSHLQEACLLKIPHCNVLSVPCCLLVTWMCFQDILAELFAFRILNASLCRLNSVLLRKLSKMIQSIKHKQLPQALFS